MELPGPALWDVFVDGARVVRTDDRTADIVHTLDAGYLTLPTGRIVLSDPYLDPWNEPFSARVPPGSYPVRLSVIHGDNALVMVTFGDEPPASWRPADSPDFAVDSATGCLMDRKVCRFLRKQAEAGRYERYARRFRDALDETDGAWAPRCFDQESGANVVLFRTWGGDGGFRSYYGDTAGGALACLVVDMYLESDEVVGVSTASEPGDRGGA